VLLVGRRGNERGALPAPDLLRTIAPIAAASKLPGSVGTLASSRRDTPALTLTSDVDETYRMLGQEREADLEREAEKWRRAAPARGQRPASVPARFRPVSRRLFFAAGAIRSEARRQRMKTSNDSRGMRRTITGVSLIAAPLALAAAVALLPSLAGEWPDVLARLAANETALLAADLLVVVAIILLIPGMLGLLRIIGRPMPRLAPTAVAMFLVGWLFVLGPVMLDRAQLQIARSGIPRDQAVALVERLEADAGIGVIIGIFIIGHTLGAILLGIAVARARFVPTWAAASIAIAAVLHPIARVGLGSKWLDVFAFSLLALGLAVTGFRVLRMSDEEWEPSLDARKRRAPGARRAVAASEAA
jgi:hypothetical protein